MTDDDVLFSIDRGVAAITLNRPAHGNAMSFALMEALAQAVEAAESDPDCHVVVLRSTGRVFCGGGDLRDLARASSDAELQSRMVTTLQDTMFALAASRLAVIAAVNGAAAGAGLGLVLNCDIVLASPRASFHGAYGAIGLSPDAGVSHLLPRAIGVRRASAVLLTGARVSAQEAYDWGLVAELHEPEAVDSRADELAHQLVEGPSQALAPTKTLLAAAELAVYRAQLDRERESITALATHPDTQRRIQSMLSK